MRKLFPLFAVSLLFSGMSLAIAAAEKMYTGEAVCAKCALGETPSCQNTLSVDEAGKKVLYYLEHNDVSKKAHGALKICTAQKDAPVKLVVTGTDKEEAGKKVITASKIEVAK
jgi:hypothetical protein